MSYDEIEGLSKLRKFVGDVKSGGQSIRFSIRGETKELIVPSRRIGEKKQELYFWLLEKNPIANVATDQP